MDKNNAVTLKLSIDDGAGTDIHNLVEAESNITIEDNAESYVMVKISKRDGKYIIVTQSFDYQHHD